MVLNDPYEPERGLFECPSCNSRTASEDRVSTCPECGDQVRNLAVARE
jgi:Zn finger protein HypA/HybF involved in hydrogenase expression